MNKITTTIIFLFVGYQFTFAQSTFANWTDSELTLNNGLVERIVKLPVRSGSFVTTSYITLSGDFKYFQPISADFQFELNDTMYSGKGEWSLSTIQTIDDGHKGNGAAITLVSLDNKVEVDVRFLLYPNSPAIRKSLVIRNRGTKESKLESVDVEKLSVLPYDVPTFTWIYSDYGRRKSIGPYEGNMQDALVILHNMDWQSGIVIGNEATGVLKRTSVFWQAPEIISGLTHKESRFPFRKWIKAGGSFETPQVFTMLYSNQRTPSEMLNIVLPDFVRTYMNIRLSALTEKPTFVYNTWNPFKGNINEKLIMELAKAAADAGMKEFVIDDGWQTVYGDWGVDKTKFPNGLKPALDYIKSLGMKPGIWISIGTASPKSKVYKEHPEWFVTNKEGNHYSMVIDEKDKVTACFGTGWSEHIKRVLNTLVTEYGIEYLKLDFSVVTSPYRFDPKQSGCYAVNHALHKDHQESLFTSYEQMWNLFDELHDTKPNLFIDCTFETMGGLQLIDYAMLKHAEGNWLSNFYQPDEEGDLRIRNIAWWRSPSIPATSLVIGNPAMDDLGWEMHIKSLAGALPIMLGDPRKLSQEDLKLYRSYSDWLQRMENDHSIMTYRQDLHGFGEPTEGSWDGYQRINTETKSGGMLGIFKHGAREETRQVYISYLDPNQIYLVKEAISDKVIAKSSGAELATKGFNVTILEMYGGRLYEVSK